jgi:hypothetical protein
MWIFARLSRHQNTSGGLAELFNLSGFIAVMTIPQNIADLIRQLHQQVQRDNRIIGIGNRQFSGEGYPQTANCTCQVQFPAIPPTVIRTVVSLFLQNSELENSPKVGVNTAQKPFFKLSLGIKDHVSC